MYWILLTLKQLTRTVIFQETSTPLRSEPDVVWRVSGALRARWFLGKTHVMGRASLLAVQTGFSWEGRGGEERGGARYRLSLSIGQSEKEQGSSKRKENHQFASFFSPN